MKVWLNQRLGEALQETMKTVRTEAGPKLCCEVAGLTPQRGVQEIYGLLLDWERDLVIAVTFRGSQWRTFVGSMEEIHSLLHASVVNEEVLTFVDPASLGGCSVDFTPHGEGSVEILVAAWGVHEEMATKLNHRLAGPGTFRGN